MTIRFSCPRCGTGFNVANKLAGRQARCKKCSHKLKIPSPQKNASATGRFRLESALVAAELAAPQDAQSDQAQASDKSSGAAEAQDADKGNWRRVKKDVETLGLVTVTNDKLQAIQRAAASDHYEEDDERSLKLQPIKQKRQPVGSGVSKFAHRQAFKANKAYGKAMGGTLRMLKTISEIAFTITWLCLLMILVGTVIQQRSWVTGGAIGVMVLGIGQIALNFFCFVLMPFGNSIGQAFKFFLPPYKKKQRRAVFNAAWRVVSPLIPMIGVVILMAYVPWLSRGDVAEDATIQERLRSEVDVLKSDVKSKVDRGVDAVKQATDSESLQNLQDNVRQGIDSVKSAAQDGINRLQQNETDDKTP